MDFSLSDEQRLFEETVRTWVDRECPKSWARELERHEDRYPYELWDKLAEAGFHGLAIPERYGGQGGDVVAEMILARGLARSLAGLSWVWGLTSFVASKAIGLCGDEQQRAHFLPRVARGELRFAIAFTEPAGGTDLLGALGTTAERRDGGWVIDGSKTWCTSAHVADHLLVLARTGPPEPRHHDGLSLFLVPRTAEGVTVAELPKLGMRAVGSCDVGLQSVHVEDDLLLGEPGTAWRALLPALNNERILLSAFCLGIMDGVLEDALAFVREREAFGRPVGAFQALQHYIADIAIWRAQVELLIRQAAWLQSTGRPCAQETTMAKVAASDAAGRAADLGIQILGGMGFSAETDMQRYWRDSRLFRIGPITNEMARNVIAEGLGLPRSF